MKTIILSVFSVILIFLTATISSAQTNSYEIVEIKKTFDANDKIKAISITVKVSDGDSSKEVTGFIKPSDLVNAHADKTIIENYVEEFMAHAEKSLDKNKVKEVVVDKSTISFSTNDIATKKAAINEP